MSWPFPGLELVLYFICTYNVHALVPVVEMVGPASYHVARAALASSLQTNQLSLRWTLCDCPSLILQVWYVDSLCLSELIRNRTLSWLVLYHVDLG